jgi:hypothetical protein
LTALYRCERIVFLDDTRVLPATTMTSSHQTKDMEQVICDQSMSHLPMAAHIEQDKKQQSDDESDDDDEKMRFTIVNKQTTANNQDMPMIIPLLPPPPTAASSKSVRIAANHVDSSSESETDDNDPLAMFRSKTIVDEHVHGTSLITDWTDNETKEDTHEQRVCLIVVDIDCSLFVCRTLSCQSNRSE